MGKLIYIAFYIFVFLGCQGETEVTRDEKVRENLTPSRKVVEQKVVEKEEALSVLEEEDIFLALSQSDVDLSVEGHEIYLMVYLGNFDFEDCKLQDDFDLIALDEIEKADFLPNHQYSIGICLLAAFADDGNKEKLKFAGGFSMYTPALAPEVLEVMRKDDGIYIVIDPLDNPVDTEYLVVYGEDLSKIVGQKNGGKWGTTLEGQRLPEDLSGKVVLFLAGDKKEGKIGVKARNFDGRETGFRVFFEAVREQVESDVQKEILVLPGKDTVEGEKKELEEAFSSASLEAEEKAPKKEPESEPESELEGELEKKTLQDREKKPLKEAVILSIKGKIENLIEKRKVLVESIKNLRVGIREIKAKIKKKRERVLMLTKKIKSMRKDKKSDQNTLESLIDRRNKLVIAKDALHEKRKQTIEKMAATKSSRKKITKKIQKLRSKLRSLKP